MSDRAEGRLALLPFNDVVDLEDCWLRLDTHVLQDRHELRAEGIKLGLTLEDVYHLYDSTTARGTPGLSV